MLNLQPQPTTPTYISGIAKTQMNLQPQHALPEFALFCFAFALLNLVARLTGLCRPC